MNSLYKFRCREASMFLIHVHDCAYKLQDLRRLWQCWRTSLFQIFGSFFCTWTIKGLCKQAHNPKDKEKACSFGSYWRYFWKTSPPRKPSTCKIKGRQATILKNQQEVCCSIRSVCRYCYARKEEKEEQANEHEATGTISDLVDFDEAQKTTLADGTCKNLKLVQTVSKRVKAVDGLKEIMGETAKKDQQMYSWFELPNNIWWNADATLHSTTVAFSMGKLSA